MGVTIFLLLLLAIHWGRILLLRGFIRLSQKGKLPVQAAVWLYALLFLPGTMVHELAHFFTAILLGLHTGTIALLPEIKNNGVRFGSVQVEKSDPFRSFLVGLAPTVAGFVLVLFLIRQPDSLWSILWLYLALSIASHMLPSREDMVYFVPFTLLIIALSALWYMIDPPSLYAFFNLADRTLLNIIRYNN